MKSAQVSTLRLAAGLALVLGACSSSGRSEPLAAGPSGDEQVGPGAHIAESPAPQLQWKRHTAFEADLSRALELAPEELCSEFGSESCIRRVHLVPLGGYEPFETAMLEPAPEPLATTPTVVDRVVLSACGKRVELDRALGREGKIFGGLDLSASAEPPAAESTQGVITSLYRRLLARDPDAHERSSVASLALLPSGDAAPAAEFALLACYAVGTSSEFLFF